MFKNLPFLMIANIRCNGDASWVCCLPFDRGYHAGNHRVVHSPATRSNKAEWETGKRLGSSRWSRWILVTLASPAKPESYLVTLSSDPKRAFVQDCGEWTPPGIPVFPFLVIADHGLVCAGWLPNLSQKVKLKNHTVRLGRDTAEFADVDGRTVYAQPTGAENETSYTTGISSQPLPLRYTISSSAY